MRNPNERVTEARCSPSGCSQIREYYRFRAGIHLSVLGVVLPQRTRISGPGLFRHRTHLDRFPRTQTVPAFRRRGFHLCHHQCTCQRDLGAMKAKERDLGRSSGMITQIISTTFWLYIGGIILLALFQAMPAAAYLRGKNRDGSNGGDRHVP
jgi:hypothetical protein